jgi:hypothetical protein
MIESVYFNCGITSSYNVKIYPTEFNRYHNLPVITQYFLTTFEPNYRISKIKERLFQLKQTLFS